MAYDYSRLKDITTLTTVASAGILYTNPAATKTYIRLILLYNGNSTAETVGIYVVPDSSGVGTAAVTNRIYQESIEAGGSRHLEWGAPGIILEDENDSLQGDTTTNSKVVVGVYGAKE
jgi:hypothetical protein